ncbi:MAG: type I phosphomannose isomerase catalytic subunit [Chlamydiota bacterium]
MLYPLRFAPVYKSYIWGGSRIRHNYHRVGVSGKVAESWEISCHGDGISIVDNGPLRGKSLRDLFETEREALMGTQKIFKRFPLLLKLIDAQDNLSIQVHPSTGEEAKTECWFIIDVEQESVVYAGLNGHYSTTEIDQKLASKEILRLMNVIPAKKGELISIPGGRLHGIGSGCLIFEIQQTSNTTYRVYDWERGRECHLEQAKKALRYDDIEDPLIRPKIVQTAPHCSQVELIRTPFFIVEKWTLNGTQQWQRKEDRCESLFCLEGENSLIPVGRSCLIPAKCAPITIETDECTLIRTFIP